MSGLWSHVVVAVIAGLASGLVCWVIGNIQGESRGFVMGKESAKLEANPPGRSVIKVVHYTTKQRGVAEAR